MTTLTESFPSVGDLPTLGGDLTWVAPVTGGGTRWTKVSGYVSFSQDGSLSSTITANSAVATDDNETTITVKNLARAGGFVEINAICRMGAPTSGDANTADGYIGQVSFPNSSQCQYIIRKIVNGSLTDLTSATNTSFSAGDVWKIKASGTTISLHKNGSQVDSVTDSSISSGKYGGMRAFNAVSIGNTVEVDDWTFNDVSSGLSINVSDTITITESIGREMQSRIAVSDTLTITESLARELRSNISVSDSITLTESIGRHLLSNINTSDTITISESLLVVSNHYGDPGDSYGGGTYGDLGPSGGDPAPSVSDTITISENVKLELVSRVAVSDTITITDTPIVSLPLSISVSDTITISESIGREMVSRIAVSDTLTITESLARELQSRIAVSDTITITDTPIVAFSSNRDVAVSDTITITENISLLIPTLFVAVSDTITITESVTPLIPTLHVSVYDAINIYELVKAWFPVIYAQPRRLTISSAVSVRHVTVVPANHRRYLEVVSSTSAEVVANLRKPEVY